MSKPTEPVDAWAITTTNNKIITPTVSTTPSVAWEKFLSGADLCKGCKDEAGRRGHELIEVVVSRKDTWT